MSGLNKLMFGPLAANTMRVVGVSSFIDRDNWHDVLLHDPITGSAIYRVDQLLPIDVLANEYGVTCADLLRLLENVLGLMPLSTSSRSCLLAKRSDVLRLLPYIRGAAE